MLDDLEGRLDERPVTRVPRRLLSHEGPEVPTREQQELKLVQMERYIRKHALQVTFYDELAAGARSETVTSEEEARRLGFYLFWNLKSDLDQEELTLDDLERFMRPKDARAAFAMLDADGNGRVSCAEVSAAVASVFRDRENLAASLADARSVVGSLELVIGGVLHVIMVFLYLVIFGVNVLQFYLSFSSLVLAFSFVFQQSLRMIYENAVFLFVIHPYDIGDTLLLDGEQCRVDAINITYTTLTSVSNAQVWYPNEKLRQSQFTNMSESGFKGESLKLSVDLDTPMEVLDSLKTVAQQVIDANSNEYSGSPAVTLAPSDLPFKMTLSIWWSYSHSGIDLGRMGRARTLMYKALVQELVKLGVRYSIPINGSEGKPREQAGTSSQNNDSSAAALAAAAHFTQVVATQAGLHSAK
ncbi:hypothetical protein H632_c237p0 [Helicosporidium sp. ATCC 50920]|nr:hypothetical protein H632_c237p0 [Helicosporidium sp. ATCC 50920]|eukprot:KDD76404.1 hypothetical protein H632_c237p0 [Helicosporidium sp. ATCC 50920]